MQIKVFPICDYLVTYRYHHRGIHQWPLTENLGSMWGITVFPSIPQAPSCQGELFKASMLSEDIFQALWGDFKYQENARKSIGMFNTFLPQIHVLKTLNFTFWKLLICNILQITCQIHLLATNISQNPIILQQLCLKEWRYQQKPLNSLFKTRGGEVWPQARFSFSQEIKETEEETLETSKCKST